jgi:hypothetical protein
MVEKKRVVRTLTDQTAPEAEVPEEKRCTYRFKDGRRCRQMRWAGKEVCWQHDKAAQMEKKLKEGHGQSPGFTVPQLQELLAMAFVEVMMGKMPVGRAYALGYVAQQMLAAHAARDKETKLDVKHFWEMVDLVAAMEKAKELAKERKKKETEEAKEAEEAEEEEEEEEAEEEEEVLTAEDAENTEEANGEVRAEDGEESDVSVE